MRWRLKSPASRLFIQPFIQGVDQRKYQSSPSQAFVRGIHRWPVNSPHKGPVARKMFPFDNVIMKQCQRALDSQQILHIFPLGESKQNGPVMKMAEKIDYVNSRLDCNSLYVVQESHWTSINKCLLYKKAVINICVQLTGFVLFWWMNVGGCWWYEISGSIIYKTYSFSYAWVQPNNNIFLSN